MTVTIEGMQSGSTYFIRIFPRNSKNQYQSSPKGSTITAATSSSGGAGGNFKASEATV